MSVTGLHRGDVVTVKNLNGEMTEGIVHRVLDTTVDERPAEFLDAEDATLHDYWRGAGVEPSERVVVVTLGSRFYDYPASRVLVADG